MPCCSCSPAAPGEGPRCPHCRSGSRSMNSNSPNTTPDPGDRPDQLGTTTAHPRASCTIIILTRLGVLVRPTPSHPPAGGNTLAFGRHVENRYRRCIPNQLARAPATALEHSLPHRSLQEQVRGAVRAELSRQVLPFGSLLQQLKDSGRRLAAVRAGTGAPWLRPKIRHARAESIQQALRNRQHGCIVTNSHTPVKA